MIDNAFNADSIKARSFFDGLQPKAAAVHTEDETVRAAHQITGVHLQRLQTLKYHKNSYNVPVMAMVVYSQLISADITSNHTTNVVDLNGEPADYHDRNRKKDERAIYVLNAHEMDNVIKSGAYDHADGWGRDLNANMVGLSYERPTDIKVRTIKLYSDDGIGSTQQFSKPKKRSFMQATLVKSDTNLPFFSESTTDNDFSFLLTDTLNTLYKDNQANDDGFRIDKAIVNDSRRKVSHDESVADVIASTPAGKLDVGKLVHNNTDTNEDESSGKSLHKTDASIINPDYLAKVKRKKAQKKSLNAQRDHISDTPESIKNPLNLTPKSSSNSSQSSSDRAVSRRAASVNHEIDLNKPLDANGHPVVKSNHVDSDLNSGDDGAEPGD